MLGLTDALLVFFVWAHYPKHPNAAAFTALGLWLLNLVLSTLSA